ncbi:MAG TPA: hypothetical protein DEB17_10015 [Chlorobaculum sp.]|uniref:Uncharacterized protein n=1 Tax=Chlorobaculum tepidum (strain ATCC 49652 / DSM 12025 / NBRC 103806 / TLS) TaxID=194439 RepID=Q8KGC3_CHLTE|nr:hypothetical protein CT0045 [Chlorobaculum tepidum TLS]HBU24302.1 hypothetical protein [Chlorobaculum sp.]
MVVVFRRFVALYDRFELLWEDQRTERMAANLLILAFAFSLALIELARQGLLPAEVAARVPKSHYYAINTALSMLLGLEVFGLVFSIAKSVSASVGKQFEILSLILLRHSFSELVHFSEPLDATEASLPVLFMLAYAGGGLLIFLLLGVYYRLQHHRAITRDKEAAADFIVVKKIIALLLLLIFFVIGVIDGLKYLNGNATNEFFSLFFTILIFSDVLLVLISLRYSSSYPVVFRNSGFAVATLLIRLALTAPPWFSVLLGIGAIAFSIGITFAYNRFENLEIQRSAPI